MIIELQNFGPIKSFKFDTSKDMHAIFGKNNIGKSYAISAVYLILKNLKSFSKDVLTPLEILEFSSDLNQQLALKIEKGYEKEQCTEISKEIEINLKEIVESIFIKSLQSSYHNTFLLENLKNLYSNQPVRIFLYFNKATVTLNVLENAITVDKVELNNLDKNHFHEKFTEIYPEKYYSVKVRNLFFNFRKDPDIENNSVEITKRITFLFISNFIFSLRKEFPEFIYMLPASRSGLYNALNSFGPIIAELSRHRSFITRKIEIPSLSEPISDYFLNLNTIGKTQANEHYLTHFEEIEQDILKGKITLDNETKKYYYVPTDTDMRLELSFTSSMISEIAPIIAHLKYIIPLESDKPSILFIEEPEAHLHPEIQILLLEYFVKLSKGNVKIVMTSHSNYIFNKLSNLLIANEIDKEKLSVSLMKMTPEGSVIEEGAMQMDEYGIEDNNFVDVAEQLYEERMSLLEKL